MTFPTVFITGGSGFVGRRVLEQLRETSAVQVRVLVRDPDAFARTLTTPSHWQIVRGALDDVASWRDALEGVHTVLHLASSTGKVPKRVHHAVIVSGTESLLAAARHANVQRMVFVSSVAAGFGDRRGYPYAEAKYAAEQLVGTSGLDTLILRPTLVFGDGSAVQEGLRRLAQLPAPMVFGDGRTPVQPIHVDDLAELLVGAVMSDRTFGGATCTVGGPDVVTLEALLRRLRNVSADVRYLHIPIEPLRTLLALLEPLMLPVLPFTAGQLSTFANSGAAGSPCAILSTLLAGMTKPPRGLDAMLSPVQANEASSRAR